MTTTDKLLIDLDIKSKKHMDDIAKVSLLLLEPGSQNWYADIRIGMKEVQDSYRELLLTLSELIKS